MERASSLARSSRVRYLAWSCSASFLIRDASAIAPSIFFSRSASADMIGFHAVARRMSITTRKVTIVQIMRPGSTVKRLGEAWAAASACAASAW
jgi:hypothetical protein